MATNNLMTAAEYREYLAQQLAANGPSKSKYKNKKKEIDGHKFDSQKEAQEYLELKRRKLAGDICDFQMQVRFKFVINEVLISSYRVDFVILHHNGSKEYIDIKGYVARGQYDYVIRKKLMLALYGIKIIEK